MATTKKPPVEVRPEPAPGAVSLDAYFDALFQLTERVAQAPSLATHLTATAA
ncbi:MAG: hypothetical protein V4617_14975 [Gemmatimonadota bacterium]